MGWGWIALTLWLGQVPLFFVWWGVDTLVLRAQQERARRVPAGAGVAP